MLISWLEQQSFGCLVEISLGLSFFSQHHSVQMTTSLSLFVIVPDILEVGPFTDFVC